MISRLDQKSFRILSPTQNTFQPTQYWNGLKFKQSCLFSIRIQMVFVIQFFRNSFSSFLEKQFETKLSDVNWKIVTSRSKGGQMKVTAWLNIEDRLKSNQWKVLLPTTYPIYTRNQIHFNNIKYWYKKSHNWL